jgi:tRNA dimethylallyltransferase
VTPHETVPVLVLVGPTAVGKTEVALGAARRLGAEIVSADSRQVYRHMDIGTAKPDAAMRREIPHHLVDIVDPDTQYTAKDFERDARKAIGGILGRGRRALVVGGTGLYVRALLQGIFDGPAADGAIRLRLQQVAHREGKQALWQMLERIDPAKARAIDPNNLARVIRAIEIHEVTGRAMSELEQGATPLGLPCLKVGLRRDRADLGKAIDLRVDRMFASGLVGEVRRLTEMGYSGSAVVRKTLGYKEVLQHLEGETSLAEATALIKKNTRSFAKRQMTWFGAEQDIRWLDTAETSSVESTVEAVCRSFGLT